MPWLTSTQQTCIIRSPFSVGLYGAEDGGTRYSESERSAAELERVSYTEIRTLEWPLPEDAWEGALRPRRGRGPI
eukprot:4726293-Amphidinium_carterae.1